MTALAQLLRGFSSNETDYPDLSLEEWISRTNPTLLRYEHVPGLVSVAQRVADHELKRVLVCLTPRYFKTEVFSRELASYYLYRWRTRHVGLASHSADLAWSISEESRNYLEKAGGHVRRETSAKKRWRTLWGGEMWATGVGGGFLGRGFHLGLVDDPSDPEKAHSPTYQRRFEEWWPGKWLSRQEPDAAIVVVMQRLGTEDPIDFLFRREVGEDTDEAPENWHVVICDEVRSNDPLGRWTGERGLPPTCTLEPDPRPVGDVLAPSRFSAEQVHALQRAAGPYVTSAQRQQRPEAPSGDFWRKEWFHEYDELPADAFNGGRDWDTAYTDREANSASAQIQSLRGPGPRESFPIYIEDVGWDWFEFPELVYWMGGPKPPNGKSGEIVPLRGPHYVEQKASGKSSAQALRRYQIPVTEVAVSGDKFARASSVQPIVSSGRVFVNRRVRRKLLLGERQGLLRVTAEKLIAGGPDLDVNDVFVQAILRHVGDRPIRRIPSTSQLSVG